MESKENDLPEGSAGQGCERGPEASVCAPEEAYALGRKHAPLQPDTLLASLKELFSSP